MGMIAYRVARIDELDIICDVLACEPSALLILEPDKVAELRPKPTHVAKAAGSAKVTPRFGKGRSAPPV